MKSDQTIHSSPKSHNYCRIFRQVLAIALLITAVGSANAVQLVNGNSIVNIDPYNQMGMNYWLVDGQNQLYQQWFWYRVGTAQERSIDTIGVPSVTLNSSSQMLSTYSGAGFQISVLYDLTGGSAGSGQSTVNETITISNSGGSALDFHFYQYSDYNLGGVDQDTVQLLPDYSYALVSSGPLYLGETVTSPGANLGEVAPYNQTLIKLNNGGWDNLDGSVGPLGPGDITFAFQWDFSVAAGGSVQISKVKSLQVQVVPEPASAALGLLGLGLLFRRRFVSK